MRPESVVVMGPSYGRYPESIAKGFLQNDMEAVSFSYTEPAVGLRDLLVWEYLPRMGLTALRKSSLDRTVRSVSNACASARLFVIIKGDQLPLEQYRNLLTGIKCPKILWLMDSITRVKDGLERAAMANMVLSFEGTDHHLLAPLSVPFHQIDVAADPDWYYPMAHAERRFDVAFHGRLYENRLRTLESILTRVPNQPEVAARFVGPFRSHVHPLRTARFLRRYPLTSKYLRHASYWTHDKINGLNNQSKICLNMFHPQSKDSLNPRTFETCCSGSFLLCESNNALSRSFVVGRELEVFVTAGEAAEKVTYYLQNSAAARRIALAGRERVLRDHTVKSRAAQILATLKSEGLL